MSSDACVRPCSAHVLATSGHPSAYFPMRGSLHGLYIEQFPVSAYVGSSKNLKDLKD